MQRSARLPTLLAGLALTLGSVSALRAQELDQSPVGALVPRQQTAPESLQEIYRQLASAWESQDARAITRLARGSRVHVVIQREGVNQQLAAPQLQFLLDDLFDRADEVSFRFPDYSSYDPRAEAGYAVGERRFRQDSGGETLVDRIFVGVRSERGGPVITEFRLTTE